MKSTEIAIITILVLAGIFVAYNYVFSPAANFSISSKKDSENLKGEKPAEKSTVPVLGKKPWGAYVGNTVSSFTDFEQQVGEKPNMQAVFIGWREPFPADLALPLKSNSQTLVIFWEQYNVTLDKIIAGESDEYIAQFAKEVKSFDGDVILSPLHEMNGDWSPWSGVAVGNTPEKVILAFQRIHDVFSENKNANVKWGWVVNHESVPDTKENAIENYYPGDSYVDYVGVDGFNFGDPWQTYSEIFPPALQKLKIYNKPIYIFSMASAPASAKAPAGQGMSKKAGWIKDALSRINSDPDIAGWIWFNENKEKNWLVSSDSDSLQAFKDGISKK